MHILLISSHRHDRFAGSVPVRPIPLGLAILLGALRDSPHEVQPLGLEWATRLQPGQMDAEPGNLMREAGCQRPSLPAPDRSGSRSPTSIATAPSCLVPRNRRVTPAVARGREARAEPERPPPS